MADEEEYLQLKDLRISLDHEALEVDGNFSFCLWLYLPNSAQPSSIIIHQVCISSKSIVFFCYTILTNIC